MSYDKTLGTDLAAEPTPSAGTPAPEGSPLDSMLEGVLEQAARSVTSITAFGTLGLAREIVQAVAHAGYESPTPVQAQAIPAALEGTDLLVSAQTGSGKTAAFVLPALQRVLSARNDPAKRRAKGVSSGPRVLVLAPTRELALQVSRAAMQYGRGVQGFRVASVVGGVPYGAQLKALRGPLDLLVATPGRLMDLMGSGAAVLAHVDMLVLDEADRMLDMGFIDDIRLIAEALPRERQTLMFSATFGGPVGQLARSLTREPRTIRVDSHTEAHAQIEQRLYWADGLAHKYKILEELLTDKAIDQALVFTSTQREADEVAIKLAEIGHAVAALHGGMPQGRRNRVLTALRQRNLRVLVATDVAARGIDVPTISHVINYGLPMKEEDYVHRIGRTGRAGRNGLAVTLAERRDAGMIRRIERYTTQPIANATLPGLEPRQPMPQLRPKPGDGARGGFVPRGGFGGPGPRGPRPAAGGRDARDSRGAGPTGAPRHGGQDRWQAAPAGDRAPGTGFQAPRDERSDRGAPRDGGFGAAPARQGKAPHRGQGFGAARGPREGQGPGQGAGWGPQGPRGRSRG